MGADRSSARASGGRATGLWHHESGGGPLVVLVHGAMDRASGMLRVRRELQADHRVVRYDRRGYGRSRAVAPDDDFQVQVDDLAAMLDGRQGVVAGHSFGGVIALALAQRSPELVRAVVAFEPPAMWSPWWPHGGSRTAEDNPEDAAEWFLRRMIGDHMWERLPAAMRADRRAEGRALLADLRSVRAPAPTPYEPERIQVPLVVARGEAARPHQRRATDELVARAPRAELHVVSGADHGVHLSRPQAFASLVRSAVRLAGPLPPVADDAGASTRRGPGGVSLPTDGNGA